FLSILLRAMTSCAWVATHTRVGVRNGVYRMRVVSPYSQRSCGSTFLGRRSLMARAAANEGGIVLIEGVCWMSFWKSLRSRYGWRSDGRTLTDGVSAP